MRKSFFIIPAVSLFFVVTAFAETYVDADGKTKMHLGGKNASSELPKYSDPKKTIQTESEKTFIITLDSNRTTGYEWQISQPFDKMALEVVGVEYVKGPGDMPGAGGEENWTFRALVSRREAVPVYFKYIRPWEKDGRPANEVTFRVIISKGPVEQQLAHMQKELDKMRNESWTEHLGQ